MHILILVCDELSIITSLILVFIPCFCFPPFWFKSLLLKIITFKVSFTSYVLDFFVESSLTNIVDKFSTPGYQSTGNAKLNQESD